MSGEPASLTVAAAVRAVARALNGAGIEDGGRDARLLVAAAISGDGAELIRAPTRVLSAAEEGLLREMTRRRVAREPVSRILGWREFYGRRFAITPDVLDPRADTETVVEAALEVCARERWHERPIRILDLGTGSGCLLVTLLAELPLASGVGVDICAAAVEISRGNARALGVAARSQFEIGDMCAFGLDGYELVVSNPPYIPTAAIAGLAPEVAQYDPRAALDGGAEGMKFYRAVLAAAADSARVADTPQWLVLEAGYDQAGTITGIGHGLGFIGDHEDLLLRRDLGGVMRCVALKTRK